MKMYLSSYRLGDQAGKLVEMAAGDPSAVVIANAMDFIDGDARQACAQREVDDLGRLGFSAVELDLREYFDHPAKLVARLEGHRLIWVRGGNTFILRRAMKQSGFDGWLIGHVGDPNLVYGGYSAGIVLLGRTLRGLELVDSPSEVPPGYSSEVVWDGLGLIDYSLAPHYRSDHPESEAIDSVVRYFVDHNIEYRTLRDGDVITYDRIDTLGGL